jgi:hypothetical protein
MFADDLKIFLEIRCINNCHRLQSALDALNAWAIYIGLDFNISKCLFRSFYKICSPIIFSYTLCNLPLAHSGAAVSDLGIIMDRAFTFYENIEKTCCKALKTLDPIKRVSTEFKLLAPLKALYCAFVGSVLEYDTVIWDPYTATSRSQIEKVHLSS